MTTALEAAASHGLSLHHDPGRRADAVASPAYASRLLTIPRSHMALHMTTVANDPSFLPAAKMSTPHHIRSSFYGWKIRTVEHRRLAATHAK